VEKYISLEKILVTAIYKFGKKKLVAMKLRSMNNEIDSSEQKVFKVTWF
jgi:hypothetical protein